MTSSVNKAGTDWLLIKSQLNTWIKDTHLVLEGELPLEEYHRLGGEIRLARKLIEWVEPTNPPQTVEDNYGLSDPKEDNYG
jgi:hypothetical protein